MSDDIPEYYQLFSALTLEKLATIYKLFKPQEFWDIVAEMRNKEE